MSRTFRMGARARAARIPLAVLLCVTLAGCASQGAEPVVSFPAASAPPSFDLDAGASPGDSPTGQGAADAVSAKIIDLAGAPVGDYESGWVTFTVVVSNASTADVMNFLPLVVFGPCTCDPSGGDVPPHSILQVYDSATKAWSSAASVSTDAGGHYQFEHQVLPDTLAANQSLTYQYRVTLSAKQTGMRDGTGSIEVYLDQQPGHKRITDATGPDAAISLAYNVG